MLLLRFRERERERERAQRPGRTHLELRLLHLGCCRGHLVLQMSELSFRGGSTDAARTLLQIPQFSLKPVHCTWCHIHLHTVKWFRVNCEASHKCSVAWETFISERINTFSSSLPSCSSSLLASSGGMLETSLWSDWHRPSPIDPWIRSSVAFSTFSTSVVMPRSDAAEYFYSG